jgi:hypothetical protein
VYLTAEASTARGWVAPRSLAVRGEGLVERLSIHTITGWEMLAGALLVTSPLVGQNARVQGR